MYKGLYITMKWGVSTFENQYNSLYFRKLYDHLRRGRETNLQNPTS